MALLEKSGNQNTQLIIEYFEWGHQDVSLGLISFEIFAITQAIVNHAILERTHGEGAVADAVDISEGEVRKLAEAGKFDKAHLLPYSA